MRRLATIIVVLCLNSMAVGSVQEGSTPRPNVVIIMADDMGFSDIGCYGGEIQTPNLDRLAAGGLRFRQFYNTGRCCPTRAALLTGLYPHQAGIGHMMDDRGHAGYRGDLSAATPTVAEVMKRAGYATWMCGKWHVTRQVGEWTGNAGLTSRENWPLQRGFDRFVGTVHGAGSYFDPITLTRGNDPLPSPEGDFYYTDFISDEAVALIRENDRSEGRPPFFLYVAYSSPHWPLHARPDDIERCANRYDDGWDVMRQARYRKMIQTGVLDKSISMSERDPSVVAWDEAENKPWERRAMEVYAAQVEAMDRGIGRIVAALEKSGALENTLVLFLADNGGCAEEIGSGWKSLSISQATRDGRPVKVGNDRVTMPGPEDTYQSYGKAWANASNTPFRWYKHFVHEGGISSPLVVHWPNGIDNPGGWRDDPAHVIDLMATCVDVSGRDFPETWTGRASLPPEGVSLVPSLRGEALDERSVFFEHEGNRAIRQAGWKLVSRHGSRKGWELYDLRRDRSELNDLAAEHPERVVELELLWNDWAHRVGVQPWPIR